MNDQYPEGLKRFIVQLNKLSPFLNAASKSPTPALTLFESAARQYTFYLEALARIYRKIHDETAFNNLRKEFKLLEDQLGSVDFYNTYYQEFLKLESFPSQLLEYFKNKTDVELIALQKLLDEKKWTDVEGGMISQLIQKLGKMAWLNPDKDRKAIADFLNEEWKDFRKDFKKEKFDFTLLEQGVHEFRRQLRWFSIYAQALDGLIQLKDNPEHAAELSKYLTPEILNSPFNKMPAGQESVTPIYISAPDFYVTSWLINEIGTLKDEGLRIHTLVEAISATGMKSKTEATGYAASLLKVSQEAGKTLSKKASSVAGELMGEISMKYE
ncbi:MAG: hypothetical protein IPO83_05500 [Chitinophagaceae bacterium]|nr:hypothetical protein [Chitinophagaceae bacterium]